MCSGILDQIEHEKSPIPISKESLKCTIANQKSILHTKFTCAQHETKDYGNDLMNFGVWDLPVNFNSSTNQAVIFIDVRSLLTYIVRICNWSLLLHLQVCVCVCTYCSVTQFSHTNKKLLEVINEYVHPYVFGVE